MPSADRGGEGGGGAVLSSRGRRRMMAGNALNRERRKSPGLCLCVASLVVAAMLESARGDGSWSEVISTSGLTRYDHALASIERTVYLFGGLSAGQVMGDFWSVNLSSSGTPQWQQAAISSTGQVPRARFGHGMVTVGGDTVMLFGGNAGGGEDNLLGDLWTMSRLGDGSGQHQWVQRSFGGDVPSARSKHSMASSSYTAWLFGGVTSSGVAADLFSLDMSASEPSWKRHDAGGQTPSPRSHHGMAVVGNVVFIYGGIPASTPHMIDTSSESPQWAAAPPLPSNPARFDPGVATVGGTVWLFGGGKGNSTSSVDHLLDLYSLDSSSLQLAWVQPKGGLSTQGRKPGGLRGIQQGLVQVGGSLALFGGIGQFLNQALWVYDTGSECTAGEFNGSTTPQCDQCQPGTYSLQYATACSSCAEGTYADVAGKSACEMCYAGTFSAMTGASSASACISCHSGTFSASQGLSSQDQCLRCPANTRGAGVAGPTSVDVGCVKCGKGTVSGQGATMCRAPWYRVVPEASRALPEERKDHAVAAVGDDVYVFGGEFAGKGLVYFDDLWRMEAGTQFWNRVGVRGGEVPSKRAGHGMVAIGARLFVFGGRTQEGQVDDMWTFDIALSLWLPRPQAQTGRPTTRYGHGMVGVGDHLWLFGGTDNLEDGLSDLYSIDVGFVVSLQWKKHTVADAPPRRFGHGMAHAGGGIVYVYGGQSSVGSDFLADLHRLDTTKTLPVWSPVSASGAPPSGRSGFGFASTGRVLWMIGGATSEEGLAEGGLWRLDTSGGVVGANLLWEEATSAVQSPGPRGGIQNGLASAAGWLTLVGGVAGELETWRISSASRCSAGSYGESEGSTVCYPCSEGKFSIDSSTACVSCSPGTYLLSAREGCEECPAGTVSSVGAVSKEQCRRPAQEVTGPVVKLTLGLVVDVAVTTLAQFEGIRVEYIAACADAGGVSTGDVKVREVVEVGGGEERRVVTATRGLLQAVSSGAAAAVRVTTLISVFSTSIDSVLGSISSNLTRIAVSRNLPAITIVSLKQVNASDYEETITQPSRREVPTAAIIGGVVGGSAFLAAVVGLFYYRSRARRREELRLRSNFLVTASENVAQGGGPQIRSQNLTAFGGDPMRQSRTPSRGTPSRGGTPSKGTPSRNGNGSDAYAGVESGDEDELSGIEIDVGSEDEEEGGGGGGGRKGKGSHAGQGNGRRALGTVPTSRYDEGGGLFAPSKQLGNGVSPDASPEVRRVHREARYTAEFGEFDVGGVLAGGDFKTVYRARWRRRQGASDEQVVLLVLRQGGDIETERSVLEEAGKHPNLMPLLALCEQPDSGCVCLVTDLSRWGALDQVLLRYPPGSVQDAVLVEASRQVCDGMLELSRLGLVHRDLSTHNVLVYSFHKAHPDLVSMCVSDYGVHYRSEGGGDFLEVLGSAASRDGGVRWMPPEAILEGSWGKGSDVWAFGVTMWEVWSGGGALPYEEIGEDDELCDLVLAAGALLKAPDGCPEDVYAVMSSCWRHAPSDRPSYAVLARRLGDLKASSLPDTRMCAKCATKPRGWVSSPCGHDIYCRECGAAIVGKPCVVCLRPVTNVSEVITAAALLGVGEPLRLGSLSDTESMRNGDGSDDEDEDGMQGTGPPSSSQELVNLEMLGAPSAPPSGIEMERGSRDVQFSGGEREVAQDAGDDDVEDVEVTMATSGRRRVPFETLLPSVHYHVEQPEQGEI